MNLLYQPGWPLGCFVKTIWYYEGYTQPHALERLLPDGSMAIVINLHDDETRLYDRDNPCRFDRMPGGTAMGAQSRFFVIDTAEQRHVIGAQFHPGGAWPFLRMPAGELADQHVALRDIRGEDLRERLLDVTGPNNRCRVFEEWLMARSAGRLESRPEISFAVASLDAGATVSHVIGQTGFSARHLTELFRKSVGLNPKAYSRIRRFQSALRSVQRAEDPDWCDIALGCGYFDQSHFNHDFRAFSGMNPTAYFARKTPHLNHVPI